MPKKIDLSQSFSQAPEFQPNASLGKTGSPRSLKSVKPAESAETQLETVEVVELARIKPDYNQPRAPLLPPELHYKFWFEGYTCFQVAGEWLQMTRHDPVIEGEVTELLEMGSSFKDDGQVNPVTGCWMKAGSEVLFVLETGERRFWAAVLYATVHNLPNPVVRASIVKEISRRRQIMENVHQSKPGAVSQAREIAICILEIRGLTPDTVAADPYQYVRQVNRKPIRQEELRQLEETYQIHLTPQRVNQILKLLEFPTEQLFIADHYRLSSRKLLEIYNYGPDNWSGMITLEAEAQLASMQRAGVKITALPPQEIDTLEPVEPPSSATRPDNGGSAPTSRIRAFDRRSQPAVKAMIGLRRFQKTLLHTSEPDRAAVIDQLANEIALGQEDGLALYQMLDELVALVRVRYDGLRR